MRSPPFSLAAATVIVGLVSSSPICAQCATDISGEWDIAVANACQDEVAGRIEVVQSGCGLVHSLEVTDTRTGVVEVYTNPLGQPAPPVLDVAALPVCDL